MSTYVRASWKNRIATVVKTKQVNFNAFILATSRKNIVHGGSVLLSADWVDMNLSEYKK